MIIVMKKLGIKIMMVAIKGALILISSTRQHLDVDERQRKETASSFI